MANIATTTFAKALHLEMTDKELADLLKVSLKTVPCYRTKGMPSGTILKLKLLKPNLKSWAFLPTDLSQMF